ncbi:MAG: D-cysteine desulfhydrase family protein [Candidatus Xenobiia bacterium LiM19]
MNFPWPPHISLAHIPTPLELCEYEPLKEAGITLYIKRDDLTESAASGNKARKLEFLLADALAGKTDTVITCGGVQSNHARATALYCARLKLKSILVLRGEEPEEIDGNLFLDKLAGAEIRYITRSEWQDRDRIMEKIADELEKESRKAYIVPEGASNALGSIGYVKAVEEIAEQCLKQAIKADYIISATGSGGTQAGMIAGCRLFMPDTQVLGVNVCNDESYFMEKIAALMRDMQSLTGIDTGAGERDIRIIDGYVGRGYALSRPEELRLIHDLARHTGVILDPVYNGKAFYCLMEECRRGRFNKSTTVVFLHSGGIFGLFPKKREFSFR